ncbi:MULTISPECIES: peptide chain release factor H [unclassified Novosphingobium]|uniref:peptide chain release factor H n=1 Tax=unclassified Novosphingobium TaxID=2644732 RepID=UPI001469EFE6|nr:MULTISPECIES: peptide chain release factor H [unclassified Novosphingobium]NMN05452.1 peptide chain release factor [Novosphingobium sp. SG919]NMN88189.1 peptide chain release factor [Novosphingobium sp. SG916]
MSEVILHVTAGKGPQECRWVVAGLARAFAREAKAVGLECEVLDGAEERPASILLRLAGEAASAFAAKRIGTNQWIGNSPFRPTHKRRNWFVGVSLAPKPDEMIDLREEDIDYQAMRASGPGGQHVNKTDSAVRATHRPTGLVATAQEQRSQHANRKLARLKLAIMLEEWRGQAQDDARRSQWQVHQELERGNAVRIYAGERFQLRSA